MADLNALNEFKNVANMIHSRQLSDTTKNKFKYLFLEGLIKFLKLYAVNEIGNQVDLDLYRISMYVNSVRFENEEAYYIRNLEDVYKYLTDEVILGYPIWRFLKLTPSQSKYLESEYDLKLEKVKEHIIKLHNCQTCYYYYLMNTQFGILEKCYRKKKLGKRGSEYFDSREVKRCKYYSVTKDPNDGDPFNSGSVKELKINDIDSYRISRREMNEMDSNKEKWKNLDSWDKAIESLGRVMSGRKAIDNIEKDSLNANRFSYLYQFIDIHSKIEYGESFEPNISKIASDIYSGKYDKYKTEDSLLEYIEKSLIKNPNWANKYIKRSRV